MLPRQLLTRMTAAVLFLLAVVWAQAVWGAGAKYKVLYSFTGGEDGIAPIGNLVFDASGNFYGTTAQGGVTTECHGEYQGCGVVFQLVPRTKGHWKENVLYRFPNGSTGGVGLNGNLVLDAVGHVYGTAFWGGVSQAGSVFQLTHSSGGWTESDIYSFCSHGCNDGENPESGVIFDKSGSLFGTTAQGGTARDGVIYELTPGSGGWKEKVLYNFCPSTPCEGGFNAWGLTEDADGTFFSTTTYGGDFSWPCTPGDGCGVIFELKPEADGWKYAVLHRFFGPTDGAFTGAGVVQDASGNFYGTTTGDGAFGCGTVYQLSPKEDGWSYEVLYNLRAGVTTNALTIDAAGNLYGTSAEFSGGTCRDSGNGEIFKLSLAEGHWKYTTVYKFSGGQDGVMPSSGLIQDKNGNFYGVTAGGGNGYGVVFELTP
jgi:uncharacterized repeat protein (TIGR03803 family)